MTSSARVRGELGLRYYYLSLIPHAIAVRDNALNLRRHVANCRCRAKLRETTMAINLDDYRRARAHNLAAGGSDVEVAGVTQKQAFGAVRRSQEPREKPPLPPDDFLGPDLNALMLRVRALASQI